MKPFARIFVPLVCLATAAAAFAFVRSGGWEGYDSAAKASNAFAHEATVAHNGSHPHNADNTRSTANTPASESNLATQRNPIMNPSTQAPSTPATLVTPAPATAASAAAAAIPASAEAASVPAAAAPAHEIAVFGAGCFWCVEPAFEMRDGVLAVESGYMGGSVPNPTYEQICRGDTGHAEVVKVTFDPQVISYAELVDWFFLLHDPTTLNRQGADVGTQYRSVIFTYGAEQQAQALAGKARAAALYADPIVTFVEPAQTYYPAEDYHQDYFSNNPAQPYCRAVIAPKLQKLKQLPKLK